MVGIVGLSYTTEGFGPVFFGGLLAWSYYRLGHEDGKKEGRREALGSGWKIGSTVSRTYKIKLGRN